MLIHVENVEVHRIMGLEKGNPQRYAGVLMYSFSCAASIDFMICHVAHVVDAFLLTRAQQSADMLKDIGGIIYPDNT